MHHVVSSSLFLWGLLRKAEAWPSRLSLSLSLGPPHSDDGGERARDRTPVWKGLAPLGP